MWRPSWPRRRSPARSRSPSSHAQVPGRQPPRRDPRPGEGRVPRPAPGQARRDDRRHTDRHGAASQPRQRSDHGHDRAGRRADERRVPQALVVGDRCTNSAPQRTWPAAAFSGNAIAFPQRTDPLSLVVGRRGAHAVRHQNTLWFDGRIRRRCGGCSPRRKLPGSEPGDRNTTT